MLLSLCPKTYMSRQPHQRHDAFEWVLSHNNYQAWLESPRSGILHLHGHQGSRRTLLSRLLFQSLRETTNHDAKSIIYFSFDEHDENQSSTAGLLSSLLVQLLLSDPSNFGKFTDLY